MLERDGALEALIAQKVPCAAIRKLDEVLGSETAQSLVLEEEVDGLLTKLVATKAFRIIPQ